MARIALIGCGLWGERILRDLVALGAGVIAADPDHGRRKLAEEVTGRPALTDAKDLPPVDGIVLATPAATHAALLPGLLRRGVPVFAEKPLTVSGKDARALAALPGAERLFVMHVWRYHRGVEKLGEIARQGTLGPVHHLRTVRANWTSPRTDVDSIWTLVPHDISIALGVLGRIPEPQFAQAECLDGRAVGLFAVLGEKPPHLLIDASTRYADRRRELRLHCEMGVAVLAGDTAQSIVIDRETLDGGRKTEEIEVPWEPPLQRELTHFLNFLAGGPPPPTDLEEGVTVVETVEHLRRLAGLQT